MSGVKIEAKIDVYDEKSKFLMKKMMLKSYFAILIAIIRPYRPNNPRKKLQWSLCPTAVYKSHSKNYPKISPSLTSSLKIGSSVFCSLG